MKIIYRIIILGLLPLVAFLSSLFFVINQKLDEKNIFQEMVANIQLFSSTSSLIADLQRERGGTALYLSGGSELSIVENLRKKTDNSLKIFTDSLKLSYIKTNEISEIKTIEDIIKNLRDKYSVQNPELREQEIDSYTQLIKSLLSVEALIGNGKTSKGLGKKLSSLMILEVAKESAGLLRANGSSLFALGRPLTDEQFTLIVRLKAEIDANLVSPALVLDTDSHNMLKQFSSDKNWRLVDDALHVLLSKSREGNYGISGDDFFKMISIKVEDIAKIIDNEKSSLSKVSKHFMDGIIIEIRTAIIVMTAVVIVVIIVGFTLSVSVSRRIKTVVDSLKDIAEGDGDLTVRLKEGFDELGVLSRHFNQFVAHIQDLIIEVRDNASSLSAASTQMSSVASTVSQGAVESSGRSSTVSAAAEEMSVNTVSVAASVEEASANLNSVASAAEEMSVTIADIAGNSEKAKQIGINATQQVNSMNELMGQLVSAADEIGNVTNTIAKISSQTNLLALNATIEAARAGEAGRGFSVVANEIKELARQTTSATEHIRERIDGIQASTNAAMDVVLNITIVMSEVSSVIEVINHSISEQSSVTRDIVHNILEATSGVHDANTLVAEIATASESVAINIGEVHSVSESMTQASKQVYDGAENLSKLSQQLQFIVNRFKLD